MRIYFLLNNPYNSPNPYVATIMDCMRSVYNDVEFGYGIDRFWEEEIFQYDIIHIHWPDVIIDNQPSCNLIKAFKVRLLEIRKNNIDVAVTCHNFQPHYCKESFNKECYAIVYGIANIMLHLGRYSKAIMEKKYPQAKHILIYHHTYDTIYSLKDRDDSLKMLKLNPQKRYILCFGQFRDEEERELVDIVAKHFYNKNIEILAPRYFELVRRRNFLITIWNWIKIKTKEFLIPGLHIYGWYITDEMLPFFYAASDVSLIQRKKILNSGSLPMGFFMSKVVVGPDVGNVGELLKETGNPTFSIDSFNSLIDALEKAFALFARGKGIENKQIANRLFLTSVICEKLHKVYEDACQCKI